MSWVLAIDFGTANTIAAHAGDGAAPQPLTVDGLPSLPSAVAADPDGRLVVGRAARSQAYLHPERTERAPKRALVAGGDVILGDRAVKPAELAAAVLRTMYAAAVRSHGGVGPGAVILTHPARWGRPLTDRLNEAAELAGRGAERTQAAIRAAGVDPRDLAGLYLAGGAAGTPLIARRLSSALGVRPRLRDDPKAAVALGALRAYAPPRPTAAPAAGVGAAPARPVRARSASAKPKLTELPPGRGRSWDRVFSFNAGAERALAAWSPDDSHLAVSLGQGVEVWSMPDGVKRKSLTWRIWSAISALAWSPDGGHIVTGQVDSSALKIWSVSGGMRQLALPGAGSVRSLAWHPDGDRIAVVDDQGTVRVVDQGTGTLRAIVRGRASGLADAPLAWHPAPAADNDPLIVAGEGGTVLRLAGPLDAAGLFEFAAVPGAVAWSNDGSRLAACGGDSVRFWHRAEPSSPGRPGAENLGAENPGGGRITAARWTPDDRYLLTSLGNRSRPADQVVGVALWDAASGEPVRSWTDVSGEFEPCRGIALSSDGTRIACVRRDQPPALHALSAI